MSQPFLETNLGLRSSPEASIDRRDPPSVHKLLSSVFGKPVVLSLTGESIISKASIPRVLLFDRCCLFHQQQHCLERRDQFCEQHGAVRRYDCEMYSLTYLR